MLVKIVLFILIVKKNGLKHMNKKIKEWLSAKEAILLFKQNNISLTTSSLRYLCSRNFILSKKSDADYHNLYNTESIKEYIKERKNIPSKSYIKVTDLAKELHVHRCRIYKKLKEYNVKTVKHLGITYVNKQEFLKKYKAEYDGNTDRRKEARN
jgi:hypothetical protein